MKNVLPLLLLSVSASIPSLHAEPLHYAFKAADSYIYAIRIEAEEPTYKDVLAGDITLTAQAGVTGQESGRLTHTGVLLPTQLGTDGTPLAASRPSRLAHLGFGLPDEEAWWGVDSSGHVSFPVGARRAVPFSFGSLSRLLFHPLSPTAIATWSASGDCTLFIQPLLGSTTAATPLPAHEHSVYTLGPAAGDTVSVQEHYQLEAAVMVGGEPRIRITGEEQILFDTRIGMPRSAQFHGTLTTRSAAGADQTPLLVAITLLPSAPGQAAPLTKPVVLAPPGNGGTAPINPLPLLNSHAQPLTNEDRAGIMADLKSADGAKKLNAANRLAGAAADDHAPEVSQALEGLLGDGDLYVRQAAARTLGVWGGKDVVPALLKLLDDKEFSVRWAALDGLGNLRAADAATAIAQKLTTADGFKAGPALEQIGSPAAAVVVPYLKEKDWTVRLEACHILRAIGGPAQVGALESLAGDENATVRAAAAEAVKASRARVG